MDERYGFRPQFPPSAPIQNPTALSYPPQHPPYPTNQSPVYPDLSHTSMPTPSVSHVNNYGQFPPNHDNPIASNNQAYRWVDSSSSYGSVPPSAVQGGVDADGHAIYVGRAYHDGDLIPAKVIPGKNAAYVAHNGAEHGVDSYQVLCQQRFEWVPSHAGQLPPGAVQGGHTSGGELLYVGRAYHEGSQTIGKVHPSHGVCYIPFGGEEIPCPQYEVLVLKV